MKCGVGKRGVMLGIYLLVAAFSVSQAVALPQGNGPGAKGKDAEFATDRDTFHFLLTNHKAIKRQVKKLDNGVETVTESETIEVAKRIQEHVPAMYARLKSGQGVRYWDPLFAEAFEHGQKMKLVIDNTKKGVKVIETSDDPEVVKIIQAHADVVSKFVEKGFEEAHKEHPVPADSKISSLLLNKEKS